MMRAAVRAALRDSARKAALVVAYCALFGVVAYIGAWLVLLDEARP